MSTPPNQFLNGPNYQRITGFLRQRYTEKLGTNAIPERMDTRIQNTVQHYMKEISKAKAGKNMSVQAMNQEVLKETTASLDNWLRDQEAKSAPKQTKQDDYARFFEDSGNPVRTLPAQTFKQAELEEEDPVILMQKMQKQRDDQARSLGIANAPKLEIIEEQSPSAMQPVPPQAVAPPPLLAPRPQDYIIPQEDIVKYRETEYNIFLTSSDRDWIRNRTETRYNFSVNFNTGSKRQGFPFNPALQERFRNIQRIEFVKAILPIESLVTLPRVVTNATDTPLVTYDLTRVLNVFALPFMGIRIAELNNNGFSTKPEEDNTFAIVQYDTTWSSDLNAPNSNANTHGQPNSLPLTKSGYTGFIPKFLKTQKVYTPTPLATLQKLSIRMERHTGDLLTEDSDVWSVKRACLGNKISSITGYADETKSASLYFSGSPSALQPNAYIFIETTKYFPFSAISEGDNIVVQGYKTEDTTVAETEFKEYINRTAGHIVVATAYVNKVDSIIQDGRNQQGYCNVIIIQNRFDDPSKGSVTRNDVYFGGNSLLEDELRDNLNNKIREPDQTDAALINMSRQSHVVLRVITRDMDSSSNIRPDNV